eukprot:TRINITY_DN68993_c0_g1_i1.p1 TRINITY_DN68993_c0_g1~~TRINITY_DN68993_c0_g1_i1.p1  ORF type:complete len:244 (-),score=55.51 TRINITY_DN68993_c0_g1_i1:40-714(-)
METTSLQKALVVTGGAAAAAGLLWYLFREGNDEEDSPQASATASDGIPKHWFKVTDPSNCAIGIRVAPDVAAPKTGRCVTPGEVFSVSEIVEGAGGQRYLRLADGRGWVFTLSGRDFRLLVTELTAEEATEEMQASNSGQAGMMQAAMRLLESDPALREQVMNSQAAQGLLSNPGFLQAAAEQHSTVGEALSANPEVKSALDADPQTLAEALKNAVGSKPVAPP